MPRISKVTQALAVALLLALSVPLSAAAGGDFRPPAVPLVTYNPFLSIWSEADHLNDATTKHWTRHDHSLVSLIRIDGKTYRLMGAEPEERTGIDPEVREGAADAEHLRVRGGGRPRDPDVHATRAAGRSRRLLVAAELHHLERPLVRRCEAQGRTL